MLSHYLTNGFTSQERKFKLILKSELQKQNAFYIFMSVGSGIPKSFVRVGVQEIQLRTEDRGNMDLGAVAP